MEENEFIRTIRKSGTSLAVNIPPEIIELAQLKEGEMVKIKIERVKK